MKLITVGSDPEVFLSNGDDIISAIGLLGGTKRQPKQHGSVFVQEDNVLGEFNIPPVDNRVDFIKYNLEGIKAIEDITGMDVSIIASHTFSEDYLKCQPPQARKFGCRPDQNAWTGCKNLPPKGDITLRSAGGHIHLGVDVDRSEVTDIVKCLDLVLGFPSVLWDRDTRRKELYGKAGAFRFKRYGLEYRSLSNFWLAESELIGWVYDSIEQLFNNYTYILTLVNRYGDVIPEVINTNNQVLATQIMNRHYLEEVFYECG